MFISWQKLIDWAIANAGQQGEEVEKRLNQNLSITFGIVGGMTGLSFICTLLGCLYKQSSVQRTIVQENASEETVRLNTRKMNEALIKDKYDQKWEYYKQKYGGGD